MKELVNINDIKKLNGFPKEVIEKAIEILKILDEEYGESRDKYKDLGGYLTILESKEEILNYSKFNINFQINTEFEYIELIKCTNNNVYVSLLMVVGSDYNLPMIFNMDFANKHILNKIRKK